MIRPIARTGACTVAALTIAASLAAQQPAPEFDPAAVERGQQLLSTECGFCHGANGRGGSSGPDLTRSALVQTDEGGKQIGEFVRAGRPDRGMPPFALTDAQVSDLATFLHSAIRANINRRAYRILDILVGDPKAGEVYFNGAGRCATCHSPERDLRAVGAKYDPPTLQNRMVLPRGSVTRPGTPAPPPHADRNAIRATVTAPGAEPVTGAIVRLTDFDIVVYDAASGQMRSWLRNGDAPTVVVSDPLQGHVDLLPKWTDTDMHNVTAYLASLK
ncbi:MAG TPA: cytochrome c [Vicinamibacterales bacterium]|nr:cytochrome c [Vicinamibacterales bacterium]